MSKTTQTEWLQSRLESGQSVTPMDALKGCGCMRLASRVNDLRRSGVAIITRMVSENGSRFASYAMDKTA